MLELGLKHLDRDNIVVYNFIDGEFVALDDIDL